MGLEAIDDEIKTVALFLLDVTLMIDEKIAEFR